MGGLVRAVEGCVAVDLVGECVVAREIVVSAREVVVVVVALGCVVVGVAVVVALAGGCVGVDLALVRGVAREIVGVASILFCVRVFSFWAIP